MSRYIDADKVLEIVKDEYYNDFARSIADLTSLKELLEDTPTADVKPVVRGEWVGYIGLYKCSACGWLTGCGTFNFCPICGADMQEDNFIAEEDGK